MSDELLVKQYLEFLSLEGGCTGSSESTLAKCHIVGNHMSLLNDEDFFFFFTLQCFRLDNKVYVLQKP